MTEPAEKTIHDAAAAFVIETFKVYGIRIDNMQFKWTPDGDIDEPGFRLDSVHMATTT
jgi:hypothetical protein